MPNFYAVFIDRALRDLRHALPEFADIKQGDRVLDVCCGTGDQALHLARKNIDAWGVDLDPEMIAVAQARQKRYGKANLHFQVADAAALPFDDRYFDSAAVSLALHEKPLDLERKVVKEMQRVVRRGGAIILADFSIPARRFYRLLESLVGGEHYRNFKAFTGRGGLENLAAEMQIDIEARGSALGGGVQLIRVRN